MRIARRLIGLLFGLCAAVLVAFAASAYLALSGRSPGLLREATALAGRLMAGQRVEALRLVARLDPEAAPPLEARAEVTIAVDGAQRRSVYLLLNRGLRIGELTVRTESGPMDAPGWTRLAELVVVPLSRPLGPGDRVHVAMHYSGRLDPRVARAARARVRRDDIVLPPAALWYPADFQGLWRAEVSLELPAGLQVLHAGRESFRRAGGRVQRVGWRVDDPAPALGLVAGRFRVERFERGERSYTVAIPRGTDLDPERVADGWQDAVDSLDRRFGPARPSSSVLVVDGNGRARFHDGSGLAVVPLAAVHGGDYGFRAVAHEAAHAWWGGKVRGRWLDPDSGADAVLEGLAELSALLAVRDRFGEDAYRKAWQQLAFDPRRTGPPARSTFLAEAVTGAADPALRRRSAWAWRMALQAAGEQRLLGILRALAAGPERSAGLDEVAGFVEKQGAGRAAALLESWMASEVALDLSLDPREGGAEVRNHGNARIAGEAELWRIVPGEEPERQSVAVGSRVLLGNVEWLVLDPRALLPDMWRFNNFLPRRRDPRRVAASRQGRVLVVEGGPFPWSAVVVSILDADGKRLHRWPFDRGLVAGPSWSADGGRVLAVEEAAPGNDRAWELHPSDGSRRLVARSRAVAGLPDGTLFARQGALIASVGGRERTVLAVRGGTITRVLPAPAGERAGVVVRRGHRFDIAVVDLATGDSEVLFRAGSEPAAWTWSPGGTVLFAAVPGDWDWRIYGLATGVAPRVLVSEAARIDSLAASPDGSRLAFAALATIGEGGEPAALFVADTSSGRMERHALGGREPFSVAWLDADSLLVVAADAGEGIFPPATGLFRVDADSGEVTPFGESD